MCCKNKSPAGHGTFYVLLFAVQKLFHGDEQGIEVQEGYGCCEQYFPEYPAFKAENDRYAHEEQYRGVEHCPQQRKSERDVVSCVYHSYAVAQQIAQECGKSRTLYTPRRDKS